MCIGSCWASWSEGNHWGDTRKWVDNVRMDLQVGFGYMDWICLVQDRDRCRTLVSEVMNFLVCEMREIS